MKILFIGNSYTYFYDMPKLFEGLARANGKNVQVYSVTEGVRKLYSFARVAEHSTSLCAIGAIHHYTVRCSITSSVSEILHYFLAPPPLLCYG